eukprot:gnl/TRDRNA2_/TRDRNA2_182588_c0_seq1.p1 gnl/TRDRNA2_/TRDRNA2_182588_c0~~gnl/TRDRNA2_/TRDRNA2_182588_c0_seq1.p1  ORF type:complete len:314 (-),score=52.29 gnl/TRDRNA2_/TRDRNA2_182588_c0_seq1:27-968(-)
MYGAAGRLSRSRTSTIKSIVTARVSSFVFVVLAFAANVDAERQSRYDEGAVVMVQEGQSLPFRQAEAQRVRAARAAKERSRQKMSAKKAAADDLLKMAAEAAEEQQRLKAAKQKKLDETAAHQAAAKAAQEAVKEASVSSTRPPGAPKAVTQAPTQKAPAPQTAAPRKVANASDHPSNATIRNDGNEKKPESSSAVSGEINRTHGAEFAPFIIAVSFIFLVAGFVALFCCCSDRDGDEPEKDIPVHEPPRRGSSPLRPPLLGMTYGTLSPPQSSGPQQQPPASSSGGSSSTTWRVPSPPQHWTVQQGPWPVHV